MSAKPAAAAAKKGPVVKELQAAAALKKVDSFVQVGKAVDGCVQVGKAAAELRADGAGQALPAAACRDPGRATGALNDEPDLTCQSV